MWDVTEDGQFLRPYHKAFLDFLFDSNRCGAVMKKLEFSPPTGSECRLSIVRGCLRLMGSQSPSVPPAPPQTMAAEEVKTAARDAAVATYWIRTLIVAGRLGERTPTTDTETKKLIEDLRKLELNPNFSSWLELGGYVVEDTLFCIAPDPSDPSMGPAPQSRKTILTQDITLQELSERLIGALYSGGQRDGAVHTSPGPNSPGPKSKAVKSGMKDRITWTA